MISRIITFISVNGYGSAFRAIHMGNISYRCHVTREYIRLAAFARDLPAQSLKSEVYYVQCRPYIGYFHGFYVFIKTGFGHFYF